MTDVGTETFPAAFSMTRETNRAATKLQDPTGYPPRIYEFQHKVFKLVPGNNSPVDDVKSLNADPNDVKYLIARYAPGGSFQVRLSGLI